MLNRGGSGTSKSIPLRLWYLGSAYVFGKYLFYTFIYLHNLDQWLELGSAPNFLSPFVPKEKIPKVKDKILAKVKDKEGNSKRNLYMMMSVT